jgi:hypothetical protein
VSDADDGQRTRRRLKKVPKVLIWGSFRQINSSCSLFCGIAYAVLTKKLRCARPESVILAKAGIQLSKQSQNSLEKWRPRRIYSCRYLTEQADDEKPNRL